MMRRTVLTKAEVPRVIKEVAEAISVLAISILTAGIGSVWAQSNPPSCTKTGSALLLEELRDLDNDGIGETPIVGSKVAGETIYYQASLFILTATGQCAYEGGTICIDPPGATGCTDVTPVGGIPLLCDNDSVCNPDGVALVDSRQVSYTVNPNDFDTTGLCNQRVRAVAEYRNGTSRFGANGVFPVNADTSICNSVLFCGDGIVGNTPGETCDPPDQPGGASGNTCRANCTVCGDGHLDAGELCDDGNNVNGDGCENNCTPTTKCGDGIVGNTPGETCDPPGSVPDPASGDNECRVGCTYCGDGHLDAGEDCDDHNQIDGDGCSSSCLNEGGFCPTFNPVFGSAADCTILNFGGSFTSTGPSGQYQGDLCIGDSAHASFSGSNFVTGRVRLDHDATCTGCSPQRVLGGVELNADLTSEIQACEDARKNNTPVSLGGNGPECTETVTALQTIAVNGTITRSGTNIICLTQNQTVKGLKLAGDATTKYVFVVEKAFKFQDGKIQAVTPVGADDVLWLFVGGAQQLTSSGGGGGATCCKAVLDGSVIIDGKIALAPGLINGQVCGTGDWSFVSGSGVHCPPAQ